MKRVKLSRKINGLAKALLDDYAVTAQDSLSCWFDHNVINGGLNPIIQDKIKPLYEQLVEILHIDNGALGELEHELNLQFSGKMLSNCGTFIKTEKVTVSDKTWNVAFHGRWWDTAKDCSLFLTGIDPITVPLYHFTYPILDNFRIPSMKDIEREYASYMASLKDRGRIVTKFIKEIMPK